MPLEKLKVSCTDAACDENLHCFRPEPLERRDSYVCRECGADVVRWETLHARDEARIDAVLAELPKELVRHHYWHMTVPDEILAKARRYRPDVIAERTRRAITSHVGPPSDEIFRDGTQTANEHSPNAQVYFLGMHAVAACCRKCAEYWHDIPKDRPLTSSEQQYLAALVWRYVCFVMDWSRHPRLIEP